MHATCSMKFLRHINTLLSANSIKAHTFSSSPQPLPSDDLVSAAVTILKHHRSKSRWSHLKSLLAATKSNYQLNPSQFSQIALHLRNNAHLVLRFFHFTQRHSLALHSLSSYATVIHILSRSRLKGEALSVIKSAMFEFSETSNLDVATPVALLDALVKTYRGCDSAPFVFDLLVKACVESKKIDIGIEIYELLRSNNVFLRTDTCNSLIELASKSRDCFAGYDLYRKVFGLDGGFASGDGRNGKGIVPSTNTLNVVIIGFYREGLVEELEMVWEEMKRVGCVPNVYSFNVLMGAYCDDARMEDAMRVWEEMENKGLKRDAVAYNTMIGGFCGVGEVMRAEEIYREMVMNGVSSTCITSEHLIKGYCKIGDVESAMVLYKDMCRKGFSPGSSTVNVIVRLLCEKNEVCEALKFSRMAVKKHEAVLERESYEYLIRRLCEDGRMEEGLKLQAEMVAKGFKPNSRIYGAFIDGYMKQGDEVMAGRLREEMLGKDISLEVK